MELNSNRDKKIEYHRANIALGELLEACADPNYIERKPSLLLFASAITFVIAGEMALVFYFLGENLGTAGALYASITAIVFVFCSAFGLAFSHANTSRNLPWWRRLSALFGMFASSCLFFYGIGILSGWRSDTVDIGFQAVISGYTLMSELPVFVTALVNLFGFFLLAYETRKYLWARYWGYREIREQYEQAKMSFLTANNVEVKNE